MIVNVEPLNKSADDLSPEERPLALEHEEMLNSEEVQKSVKASALHQAGLASDFNDIYTPEGRMLTKVQQALEEFRYLQDAGWGTQIVLDFGACCKKCAWYSLDYRKGVFINSSVCGFAFFTESQAWRFYREGNLYIYYGSTPGGRERGQNLIDVGSNLCHVLDDWSIPYLDDFEDFVTTLETRAGRETFGYIVVTLPVARREPLLVNGGFNNDDSTPF